MAASDHINEQLKMFMTPREIVGTTTPADKDRYGGDEGAMWKAKQARTKKTGFNKVIKDEGIQEPIGISHDSYYYGGDRPGMTSGHHRIAASMGTPRYDQLAPVIHNEDHVEQEKWNEHRRDTAGVHPFNYGKRR